MDSLGTRRSLSSRLFGSSSYSARESGSNPADDKPPFLVRFYSTATSARDPYGRTLKAILAWPDEYLEVCHDYIQILFPLPEGSPFNMSAPVIDEAVYKAFHDDEDLRENLRLSFSRMLFFYGFELQTTDGNLAVVKHSEWRQCFGNWVRRFDHNHLRITRIIRSLRCLGLEKEASAFYAALKDVYDRYERISSRTMAYWTRAIDRPLYLAPDDYDEALGVRWLRKIEEENQKDTQESSQDIVNETNLNESSVQDVDKGQPPEPEDDSGVAKNPATAKEQEAVYENAQENTNASESIQTDLDSSKPAIQENQLAPAQVEEVSSDKKSEPDEHISSAESRTDSEMPEVEPTTSEQVNKSSTVSDTVGGEGTQS